MAESNPFFLASPRLKKRTLLGIYIGSFAAISVATGLATLLAAAAADIGGVSLYPLASTIEGLICIPATLLFGSIGAKRPDLKRNLLAFSFIAGTAGYILRSLATSMLFVCFTSVLCGFITTGIFVVAYTMIRDMYDAEGAGIRLGITTTMLSVGIFVGPVLTGFLIDQLGWRIACNALWPLFIVAAFLVITGVKASREEAVVIASGAEKRFDFAGMTSLVVFLTAFIFALSMGSSPPDILAIDMTFGSLTNTILLVIAAVGLISFIKLLKKKRDDSIIPISVLKDKNTVIMTLLNMLLNVANVAVMFFVPGYMIYIMNTTATEAGLATTLFAVIGIFLSPVFGRHIGRVGNARGAFTLGSSVRIAFTFCFFLLMNPDTSPWVVYVLMFIGGFARCQQAAAFSVAPQIQIAAEIRVLSNSVIQLAQNLGGSIGMAVFTMIVGFGGFAAGVPYIFLIGAGVAVVALIAGLFLKPLQ